MEEPQIRNLLSRDPMRNQAVAARTSSWLLTYRLALPLGCDIDGVLVHRSQRGASVKLRSGPFAKDAGKQRVRAHAKLKMVKYAR